MTAPVLELTGVLKQYGALRPLRVEHLTLRPGEHVALLGLDQPAAEVLISLVTGAGLPDSGEVHIFGRPSADIADATDWLTVLDNFGIVSDRVALLEPMTVIQNLALPFSLEIEPPTDAVAAQASGLAAEAGLSPEMLAQRVGDLDAAARMRVRFGRALAMNPRVLLLEHPSATVPRHDVVPLGVDLRRAADRRGAAMLTITADAEFAGAISGLALALEPATGRLRQV
jgi:ABC-type transporter Mla maintaining outer membrane lipid asymmetry ATPase subunit MlaF